MRALILTTLWVCGAGAVAAQSPTAPPVVIVRGEGEVRAVPDLAHVTLGTEQTARTAKDAQAAAARVMTALQQAMATAGVPKDAMRTVTFDVQAQFDWVSGKQVPRGFLARHSIDVRVDDIARVGEVVEAAVAAGGSSVQSLRFDVKQRVALEREALTRAVADARARAEAAAKGAGTTVAAVVRIEESGLVSVGPEPVMMRMAAQSVAADAPPVAAGETVIRATVTLTASLK